MLLDLIQLSSASMQVTAYYLPDGPSGSLISLLEQITVNAIKSDLFHMMEYD